VLIFSHIPNDDDLEPVLQPFFFLILIYYISACTYGIHDLNFILFLALSFLLCFFFRLENYENMLSMYM
jgi:hypothetical protein